MINTRSFVLIVAAITIIATLSGVAIIVYLPAYIMAFLNRASVKFVLFLTTAALVSNICLVLIVHFHVQPTQKFIIKTFGMLFMLAGLFTSAPVGMAALESANFKAKELIKKQEGDPIDRERAVEIAVKFDLNNAVWQSVVMFAILAALAAYFAKLYREAERDSNEALRRTARRGQHR
jgi:hypothetical protein